MNHFQLIVTTRIADYKESEAKKVEQVRIRREQDDARAAAAVSAQAGVDVPAVAAAITASGAPLNTPQDITRPVALGSLRGAGTVAAQATTARPTDDQIIEVLAMHYRVYEGTVIGWLFGMDLHAASERLKQEFITASARK